MGRVPENFKGVKGKSGRKTTVEENNKNKALNLLWYKLRKKVEEGKTLTEFEEKLCNTMLPKTIKTQQDITTNGEKIEGFNFISNESKHKTDNQTGASLEEPVGQNN